MSYCQNCGAEAGGGGGFCQNCGAAAGSETFSGSTGAAAPAAADGRQGQEPPKKIESHLVKSIAAALCCCMPFGVVGLVYAVRADALLKRGDLAGAAAAGEKAGLWSNLAIGLGGLGMLVSAGVSVIGGLGGLGGLR